MVILPGADMARAAQAAETLRPAIANAIFFDLQPDNRRTPPPQPPPRITASIGISSYREHLAPGGTQRRRESTLLRLADSAMYRAKAAGRNRVQIADPEDEQQGWCARTCPRCIGAYFAVGSHACGPPSICRTLSSPERKARWRTRAAPRCAS